MKPDSRPEIHRAAAAIFRNMGQYSSSKELTSLSKNDWDRRYPTGGDYEIWTLAYPEAFDEIVKNEAAAQNIDPSLIFAIMREESGFNEKIESWANATGLMQLILPTAKAMGKRVGLNKISKRDLKKPEINIKLGTAYLSYLDNMFSNPALIISGYNAGEGAVLKWKKERADMELDLFIENIPYSQTRGYTKRVLSTYGIYNFLYKDFHPVIRLNLSINSQ
jgi:soluble lytic murein transglycosylase